MGTKFTGAKMHKQVTDWLSDYNISNRLCLAMTFGNTLYESDKDVNYDKKSC